MVARINPCCTRAELRSLLTDRAAESSDPKLESHLEECAACREELERLAAGPHWWESARSYLSDEEPGEEIVIEATTGGHRAIPTLTAGAVSPADRARIESLLPPGLLVPSSDPDRIGRIGAYDVVEAIGRGGMGVVLKAFDPALNRFVALKVLASELAHNAAARRRFAREAQAAAAVVHDHVVPIYAVDTAGPIPYLVMACIPGYSLQERIEQTGPLEVREILRIGMQTAAGLAAAHAQGLVHRDIKPANILLENGVERVRITDFGLARAMDEASQTQSGILAGTPQYMAPEQASGESIDYRADLFSLGSVLYAMCTGHSPFRAETTVAVLRRICDGSHRPVREVNADIPEWLAAIIDKLLAKRPGDRFGSAEEVARLLAEHLAQLQHPMRRRWSPSRRLIRWATGLAAALAALVLVAFFANQLRNDGEPSSAARASTSSADRAGENTQAAPGRAQRTRGDLSAESDNFQTELGRIHQDLWRLESLLFSADAVYSPTNDPLRQIEARLQVLETEFRGPEPISQPSTAEVQKR